MEDLQINILDKKVVEKNNKKYYILRIYCSISEVVFDVFVGQKIYNDIDTGIIDNDNIINYCHFKVGSDRVFSISIY